MKTKDEVMRYLLDYFQSQEYLDQWLDFPHPDLGDKTPRSVIDDGHADAVYTLVDNARRGLPS